MALVKRDCAPSIILPKNNQWELVGDSYVYGIMYSEGFEEIRCEATKTV